MCKEEGSIYKVVQKRKQTKEAPLEDRRKRRRCETFF